MLPSQDVGGDARSPDLSEFPRQAIQSGTFRHVVTAASIETGIIATSTHYQDEAHRIRLTRYHTHCCDFTTIPTAPHE